MAPTGGAAWLTDPMNGDAYGVSFTSLSAVAGYPHLCVPTGHVHGLPCGISFVGTAWAEPALFAIGHAYEQATRHRRAPMFAGSVNPA